MDACLVEAKLRVRVVAALKVDFSEAFHIAGRAVKPFGSGICGICGRGVLAAVFKNREANEGGGVFRSQSGSTTKERDSLLDVSGLLVCSSKVDIAVGLPVRRQSEERRVGKECRSRWLAY